MIVSEVAGTTRDAIDLPLQVGGRNLVLVDTAGMRRQSKVSESVEYYTTLRTQRAVERADVALVVCDAHDGVTSQDLRIAELAMQEGCATALVLNKWDVAGMEEADLDHERARVATKLRLRPKLLTASALTGRHVDRILTEAIALGDRMRNRIPTPELNRFLSEVVAAREPPAKQGHRLKLIYMAQIGMRPPRFAIQVNSRTRVTRDYAYFVENRLRRRFAMDGVPLVIDFNERAQRRGDVADAAAAKGRALSVEVRPFRPGDEPAAVALLVEVFEGWPRQLPGTDPAAFFRWKHLESPFGPSVMVVAEADGAVIGFEALIRWPVSSGGRTVVGARGVDIAVRPAHRGRGVAGALIRGAAAGIADGYAARLQQPQRRQRPDAREARPPARRPVRGPRPSPPAAAHAAGARRGGAGRGRRAVTAEDGATEALADSAELASLLASGAPGRRSVRDRTGSRRPALALRLGGRLPGDPRAPRRTASRPGHLPRRPRGGPLWALAVCEALAADDDPAVLRVLLREAPAAARVDYAVTPLPEGSAARRAALRAGYVRSARGHAAHGQPARRGHRPRPDRHAGATSRAAGAPGPERRTGR